MTSWLPHLALLLILLPGAVVPPRPWESMLEWLGLRVALSIGANGVLFGLLGLTTALSATAVLLWTATSAAAIAVVGWRRRDEFVDLVRRCSGADAAALLFALAFTALSAYWSWFFPPRLWDSLFYHLPVGRILADPQLLEAYWIDRGRHALVLKGASGGNLLPAFAGGFMVLEPPLHRAVPPAVAVAFLGSCSALVSAVDETEWLPLATIVLAILSPAVVYQSSGFHADLLLGSLLGFTLAVACRALDATCSSDGVPEDGDKLDETLLALLALFAMLPKRSGLLVLAIPPAVVVWSRLLGDGEGRETDYGPRLALVAAVPSVAAASYLAATAELPPFPAKPGTAELAPFFEALVAEGLPTLVETFHPEAFGPHLTAGLGLLLLARLVLGLPRKYRRVDLYLLVVFGWTTMALAGIWWMNRVDWFGHWTRYLLPVQGVACAVVVSLARGLWEHAARGEKSDDASLGPGRLAVLGTAVAVTWLLPIPDIGRPLFFRFGEASARPFAPLARKVEEVDWGANYPGWERAREAAEKTDGHILSADTRIWYMLEGGTVVYDTWSIPRERDRTERVVDWLVDHDVTVLFESLQQSNLTFSHAAERRGTALESAAQSDRFRRIATEGPHRLYVRTDADAPPGR